MMRWATLLLIINAALVASTIWLHQQSRDLQRELDGMVVLDEDLVGNLANLGWTCRDRGETKDECRAHALALLHKPERLEKTPR